MMLSRSVPILVAVLILAMGGCAALPRRQPAGLGDALRSYLVDQIVDTRTGDVIPFEKLVDELAAVQVVYVGETHTSLEDHRIQLKIAQALHGRHPDLKLAMEMFPRECQSVLDRYTSGMLTEEEFIREVGWERVWGFPFALYRPILKWAAETRTPILGINASQDVVKSISRGGLGALSPTDRARVAEDFNLDDFEHRRFVEQQYEQHLKSHIRDADTFYEAQLAWEETMAETLAHSLGGPDRSARIVVLAGRGHVNYRFGTPQRTARRVDHSYKIVLPMPIDSTESMANPKMADYVWVTRLPEAPKRARLGVMVRSLENGRGLEIMGVAPDSPAERGGIRTGDVILSVNGIETRDVEILQELIAEKKPLHKIVFRRNKQTLTIEVSIPAE
jgi:uncharacterized iron-regulated protein